MYWVDRLYLSLFARWHYVVGVLCGSVVQSPWSPVRVPGRVPHVCFVSSPVSSALIVFGMSVGGTDSQADWLQELAMPTVYVLLWRLTPRRRDSPQRHFCLVRPAFGCAACEANWVVLCFGLKSASGCVVSGASWEGSCAGQVKPLSMISPGLPGRSYKAIHCWMLSVLVLEAYGDTLTVIQGNLPSVLGPGSPLDLLSPASPP